MRKIVKKSKVGDGVWEYELEAPLIAEASDPGQFVILRLHEKGERIPLTIADTSLEEGTITIVVQSAGKSTIELNQEYFEGEAIHDLAGPLGNPSEIEDYGTVALIGGGVGIALIYPIARALREAGNHVISIIGAQSADKLFFQDRIAEVSDEVIVTTDDGSAGREGFTSDALRDLLESENVEKSWAIGPVMMMKVCQEVAEEFDTELIVSLNTIMVDGTGMCGGCRVNINGETRFACVDGPEFPGSAVDFDLLAQRTEIYEEEEECALDEFLEGESK
ncbi:sulfide/dihydroorotate dehydrogenase-like FAD/NAD-binding protein [Candidatus Bipolaricaulota bacterium]|nr:sulfide/dihydroorotate dehydrogenase-like FAD/NAD-binding protein [Candidatus Bipolaricaulota bacterium]